ncbi:hypothetical protein [Lacimicrobium alkaliphilum]|uniref:Uncharacterized protein n=1 Tax=Lacimicrobium alkaliphilum TaxID=1526571 RepID=A0ABQ1R320_9ALTE|nr:hypothetical protein [Lacimicrobium alkaliphilum]GGD53198.1 hypothetical protein GCM10011357_06300 [Lacimicrobium alkaliphilum]
MEVIKALSTNHMQAGLVDLSVYQGAQLCSILKHRQQSEKWVYLLANQLRFKRQGGHKIALPRPDAETTFIWLEKLIVGGQAGTIFVENLVLDEVRRKRLLQLCKQMDVILVNLNRQNAENNTLVYGPW